MREIDAGLQAALDGGATTLCRAWKVTRADGVVMGFTDHDTDLTIEGIVYEASAGLSAGALESSVGLSVDNSEAVGAISSAGISTDDIIAGKYDRAEVENLLVNWADTSQQALLFRGYLGDIRRGETSFEAELRGLSEDLNKTVGRNYTYECDAVLGDGRCRFDVSTPGFFMDVAVDEIVNRLAFRLYGIAAFEQGWFELGRVEWTSGANAGTRGMVKFDIPEGGNRTIELWQEPPFDIAVGDTLTLTAGCDKQPRTCRLKFQNFLNYQGFPHLVGEDWVKSYPAGGEAHDGTSRYSG